MSTETTPEELADQTMVRSLKVDPRGMTLDLAPPHELVVAMVEQAKKILGDAPNYTETPVTLTVSAAGEVEHYAFTVQRVGNLTPHQARERAEAEVERLRTELDTIRAEERARCVDELRTYSAKQMDPAVVRFGAGDDGALAIVSYAATMAKAAHLLESGELSSVAAQGEAKTTGGAS